jgi:hypothetical protein
MIRLSALAFVLAFASSAQAMPIAPAPQTDSLITQVRQACGAGMHRVCGVCVRTPARRAAVRCAAGMRRVNGRCVRAAPRCASGMRFVNGRCVRR